MNSTSPRKPFFGRLVRNWIRLVGAIFVISSWFAFFLLWTLDFFATDKNPYLGILVFLVAPLFFLLGMILMGERLEAIGGPFRVDSKPGAGTRLQATAPLRAPAAPMDQGRPIAVGGRFPAESGRRGVPASDISEFCLYSS